MRCGHAECEGFLLCQLVPIPDCSGQWEPPPEDWSQTYRVYPIEHGIHCRGHRVYQINERRPALVYSPPSGGLHVLKEYL